MNTYEFLRQDSSGKTHVVLEGDLTWWEIMERFKDFLAGCGYQVSWQDLRDYCDEQSWEPTAPSTEDELSIKFDWNSLDSMNSVSSDFFNSTTLKSKNDNSK